MLSSNGSVSFWLRVIHSKKRPKAHRLSHRYIFFILFQRHNTYKQRHR